MKKRRQRNQKPQDNELKINEQNQVYELNLTHPDEQVISQKGSKFNEIQSEKQKISNPQTRKKSSLESAKQKVSLMFWHFINYLQFDRILTKQEFQSLKTEEHIIKTKYPDNYYLTYEERSKNFAIKLDQIIKLRQEEQQRKNKNCWTEIKKFLCCQGADEMDEADQMLTAASENEYFYLTKVNKSQQNKNKFQATEQSLLESLSQKNKMKNFFERPSNNLIRQENSVFKENFDFSSNPNIFEGERQSKKQIDMNAIKVVHKRQHKNKQSTKDTQNSTKFEDNEIFQKTKTGVKEIRDTNQVFIHKNQEKTMINDDNRHGEQSPVHGKDDTNLFNFDLNSQISNIDGMQLISRKGSQSTESALHNNFHGTQNSRKFSDRLIDNSISFDEGGNLNTGKQQIASHRTMGNGNQFAGLNEGENNASFIPLDQSDIIQVGVQESQQFNDDQHLRNKGRRKKKRRNQSFHNQQSLKVIEDTGSYNDEIDQPNGRQEAVQENTKPHRYSNISPSNQQSGAKKTHMRFRSEDQLSFSIQGGKQLDDHNREHQGQVSFDESRSAILSEQGENVKISKKRRAKKRNFLNIKEEEEMLQEEVVFYPEAYENEDSVQNPASKTISFGQDSLSNPSMTKSTGIKKRKKTKRLTDFNLENDDQTIVIEANEMFEQVDEIELQHKDKIMEVSQFNNHSQNSGAMGFVKAEKKRKPKAKAKQQLQKQQQQFEVVELGQLN